MTRETGDLVLTAFNARDWDNVVARFAPDGLFYLGPCAPCQGHTAIRKLLDAFGAAYDIRIRHWSHIVDGNRLATQAGARITYKRTVEGLPEARGQTIDMPFATFLTLTDDRVSHFRVIFSPVQWRNAIA
ncbi:hypothetical protein GQE99_18695 [Maritimibacter sp. DP07]|uniref:SnoaL-like domain-containing protein n=1 Tax=Maritimibacter harenae TaxID=2606218 RepID=A0A845M6Z6_9RHOB|nr:nuclear transport factor 2 family protein [Maritimibacter harenae]MZR15052.1 hypothetical protein [Maritimibacter harenae]